MKRKISASDLNREVMRLREQCASANKALREVEKQCNSLSRLLEYAVWEEDMYRCDPIVFTGPTRKFVELLTPMLLCRAADPDASQQPFQNSREEQPRSLPPEHRQHHPSTSRRCR